MVPQLVGHRNLSATRYTTLGFPCAKRGSALATRGVARHIYQTGDEARMRLRE